MKGYLLLTIAITGVFACGREFFADNVLADGHGANALTPDSIPWGAAPPIVRSGAQFAVLEGNPGGSGGDYTIRLKLPDGFRISPHWHPLRENVTIISGTFKVGMGDNFETDKMKAFPAGSFAFLDPEMHHYCVASGETIVQVHGQAPFQINYVHPEDDPSRK